jgi:hypothetical protein
MSQISVIRFHFDRGCKSALMVQVCYSSIALGSVTVLLLWSRDKLNAVSR